MNEDIVRLAVELADGNWRFDRDHNSGLMMIYVNNTALAYENRSPEYQILLDALAAQLYRQLLAVPDSVERETALELCNSTLIDCDPTYNTLKVIVDSGVLE